MTATLHTADVVLPVCAPPVPAGAVVVEGDRVVDVGEAAALTRRHPGVRVRSWRGTLTPGLVNAHAHLQYTDFASLATSGLPFVPWIRTLTRGRADVTDAGWVEATRRGTHALLATGQTAVADVVTDPCVLPALARSGLAGTSYVEVVGVDAAAWESGARARLESVLDGAPRGRAVGVSPHSLSTVSDAVVRACAGLARARGLRLHPHLAESAAEVELVASGTGPAREVAGESGLPPGSLDGGSGGTPTRHLDALGGLGADVHVAHGVHCDADDRALLAARGTTVALCPRSNATLGVGEAPVAAYLGEGVPLAVGTDSAASAPSLDLLADVRALARLARAQGYDGDDLPRRLVESATVGGAAALGRDDVGVLRAGARADLAVFDVPPPVDAGSGAGSRDGSGDAGDVGDPADPYAALVAYGEGRCVATVLGGRLVHRRRPGVARSAP